MVELRFSLNRELELADSNLRRRRSLCTRSRRQ